jgi:glyceraldehyde-3-phosphate dehydrogenase/erythrose-4-phosphate dehydrogenase
VIFRKWKMGIGTVRMPTVRKYCTTQKTGKGKRNKMDRVII